MREAYQDAQGHGDAWVRPDAEACLTRVEPRMVRNTRRLFSRTISGIALETGFWVAPAVPASAIR
jgi:hypothetical protein